MFELKLKFLGASRTVTGSKYLLTHGESHILVDCGLFQGWKPLRLKNWEPFPIAPKDIQAVILTHAHLDHSGYLPLLIKNGFQGPVYATPATVDLCRILLLDSGYLQEEEARFANQKGFSKHHPALPLYTREDAEWAMTSFSPVEARQTTSILGTRMDFEFIPSGHLLGAASVRLRVNGRSIIFSGDLGRLSDPIIKAPDEPIGADYVVMESTYGDRLHDSSDPLRQFKEIVERTVRRGGTVLIPSFAVGRAQLILYLLLQLKESGQLPDIPIYLNSPMAQSVNQVFCKHAAETRLGVSQAQRVCASAHVVSTVEESKALNKNEQPKIIIAASGMATGGRVLHHLKAFAPDPKNTIVFSGFQVAGTRGDTIVKGEKEVKIHGELWPVRAEVVNMHSLSAHADREELLGWLRSMKVKPTKVFVTHGEEVVAMSFAKLIESDLGIDAEVPEMMSEIKLF